MMRVLGKVVASAILSLATAVSAAPISWQSPTAIVSAEQALFSPGSIDYAVAWTGYGPQQVTLADNSVVNFQNGTIDGTGAVQVQGSFGICGSNCAEYYGTSNNEFNSAMGGFSYDGVETVTLTGLTVGVSYSLQIFSLDNRWCCGPYVSQYWYDSVGNQSASYLHDANSFILGTFVADAITQTFYGSTDLMTCSGPNACTNLNAVVLRSQAAVPEPAMIGLLGLGLAGLAVRRRRRTA